MPADPLRRLRGPERPAAILPALSPLPPCCGPPKAILRGLRGRAPAAALRSAALLLLPCALLPGGRLPSLLPGGRPCPPDPAAFAPADWRSAVRTIAHLN